LHTGLAILLTALLTACSTSRYSQSHDSAPERDVDLSRLSDAVPRPEPRSKYGNPASYVVRGKRYHVMASSRGYVERGIASWYGKKFHGHRTSSGERFDMYAMTAAHKTLPLPSYVSVTNLNNGRRVVVRVNDRGPFHPNRIIDLSYAAARKLGIAGHGTAMVEVRAIDPDHPAAQLAAATPPAPRQPGTEYRLFLQVGAFVSRHNAERLQARLQRRYHSLHVHSGYNPQQRVYRVRIGPLASVEEADRLASALARDGYAEPHIVVD
jgi:rare lipoprotein A